MSSSSCLISSRNSYSSFIVPKPCSRELFWPGVRTLVLTCPSSGCAVMSASKVSDLNGLPLQVTIVTTGTILPVSGSIKASSIKGVSEQRFGFSQRELELGEGIVHVRCRGHVSVELILGPVVPARGDPPCATTDRFILGAIELPELVGVGRLLRERGLATLGELAALTLVVGRQDQSLIAQHPQHSRLRYPVPIMTDHRPDLPMPPRRMSPGVLHGEALRAASCAGCGHGPFRRARGACFGLPAPPGPFGHIEAFTEPRDRHAQLSADHLEVLEEPKRPSALFFHTRISTTASPNTWISSAPSASSCCSRDEGPALPATRLVLPASRN